MRYYCSECGRKIKVAHTCCLKCEERMNRMTAKQKRAGRRKRMNNRGPR